MFVSQLLLLSSSFVFTEFTVFTDRVVQPLAGCHSVPQPSCHLAIIIPKQDLGSVCAAWSGLTYQCVHKAVHGCSLHWTQTLSQTWDGFACYDAPCNPASPLALLYCYLITLLLSSQYLLQLLLSFSLVFTHRVVQPLAGCHLVPLSSCYLAIIISKQGLVSVKWIHLSVCLQGRLCV